MLDKHAQLYFRSSCIYVQKKGQFYECVIKEIKSERQQNRAEFIRWWQQIHTLHQGPPPPCGAYTALINVAPGKAAYKNESGDLSSLAVIHYYPSEELVAVK